MNEHTTHVENKTLEVTLKVERPPSPWTAVVLLLGILICATVMVVTWMATG